jgi:hypothetical protein
MADKRSFASRVGSRLTRWESVLVMVFLMDTFEDKILFPSREVPPWAKILVKMAVIVGALGVVLHFLNRRIDSGLLATRSLADRIVLPRLLFHGAILGGVFLGYCWLKLGRLPWE